MCLKPSAFLGCLVVVAALIWSAPVCAQGIETALQLYLEADFEGAREAFHRLLESPALTRGEALEAHRYLAILELVDGNRDVARTHLEAAVALEPALVPPETAPTAFGELLAQVLAEQGEEPATIHIEVSGNRVDQGRPSVITARLDPAPPVLASRLQLRCGGEGTEVVEATGEPSGVEIEVIAGADAAMLRCDAHAESSAGAVLIEASTVLAVEHVQRRRRRVWPWLVGTGVFVVLTAVIASVVTVTVLPDEARFQGLRVEGW